MIDSDRDTTGTRVNKYEYNVVDVGVAATMCVIATTLHQHGSSSLPPSPLWVCYRHCRCSYNVCVVRVRAVIAIAVTTTMYESFWSLSM